MVGARGVGCASRRRQIRGRELHVDAQRRGRALNGQRGQEHKRLAVLHHLQKGGAPGGRALGKEGGRQRAGGGAFRTERAPSNSLTRLRASRALLRAASTRCSTQQLRPPPADD
eukprot:5192591-Pleurochrysis_carterae.AAC.3